MTGTVTRAYEDIGDRKLVEGVSYAEGLSILKLIDQPTQDFRDLVVALDAQGCEFPLQQAGLMLRNTPGAAAKIIEDHRG